MTGAVVPDAAGTVTAAGSPTIRGLHNFREVAGFPTADGRRVRPGLLYRSAAPLSSRRRMAEDAVRLGIGTIVDLRDRLEQRHTPGAWQHPALRVLRVPVFADTLHQIDFDGLPELYRIMLTRHGPELAMAVDTLPDAAQRGVLVHCTAGKDRTGMVVALALEVLGVPRADVLADFSRSQEVLGDGYLAELFAGIDPDHLPGMAAHRATASPMELLGDALAAVDSEHGGAEDFLLHHGLAPQRLQRLRAVMLEDATD